MFKLFPDNSLESAGIKIYEGASTGDTVQEAVNKFKDGRESDFIRSLRLMEILMFRSKGIIGLKVELGSSRFNPWAYQFNGDFGLLTEKMKILAIWWNQDTRFIDCLNSTYFYGYKQMARYSLWKYENELSNRGGFQRIS